MSRVLVIDDNPSVRHIVKATLRSPDMEVLEAGSAGEGLSSARCHNPELVICDLNLGTSTGWDVLEGMRRDAAMATIPIILITGEDDGLAMRRGMDLGADDFLTKPFTREQLLASVEARLKKQDAVKQQNEQANRRLLQLLEATGDMIAIVDARTEKVRYLNRSARRVTGLEPDREGPPVQLSAMYPPGAYHKIVMEGLPGAMSAGAWSGETDLATAAGGTVHVLQEILAHAATDGTYDYFSIIARDITARQRAEQEVRESETRLRTLTEQMPQVVFVKDAQSRFVSCNQRFAEALDRQPEDIIGKDDFAFFAPALAEKYRADDHSVMESNRTWQIEEKTIWRGAERWVRTTKLPYRDGLGGVVGVMGISEDITARKAAEEAQKREEVELRHSQKLQAIGQLAAGIAHEINTPTQFIGDNTRFLVDAFADLEKVIAQADALLQAVRAGPVSAERLAECESVWSAADLEYLRGEIPAALRQTLEGVGRVGNIVRAMKDFSHPGVEVKAPVDLNRVIDSTLIVCRNEWKYVADVVTEFDPSLTAVPCLPGEFNQVILNLIINASHAIADRLGPGASEKGTITVTTRRLEPWAEVRIQDTGTGIPESVRDSIFVPFFTTKVVGRGTGQGLAICRSVIVDKHGGTIEFETEVGRGTTFIVKIPLVASGNGNGSSSSGNGNGNGKPKASR